MAAKWRATRWWDVDIGDPEIVCGARPSNWAPRTASARFAIACSGRRLLPAFEMSEQKLDRFLGEIRATRPKMLVRISLCFIAYRRACRVQRGRRWMILAFMSLSLPPSGSMTSSARRSAAHSACRVANGYGGRDAGFIAHECPPAACTSPPRILSSRSSISGARQVPHGEAGEIVVTHLATRDFPFIRYRTGDIGVLDSRACACGRGLPLIKEIQGRSTDFLVSQDGTVMHGLALILHPA